MSLTKVARLLIFTNKLITDIALFAGYETQQSFTIAFKALYNVTPQAYRRKRDFYPVQLKSAVDGIKKLRGDKIIDIRTVNSGNISLIDYRKHTRFGFLLSENVGI